MLIGLTGIGLIVRGGGGVGLIVGLMGLIVGLMGLIIGLIGVVVGGGAITVVILSDMSVCETIPFWDGGIFMDPPPYPIISDSPFAPG
jgi:hypothetical protein